MATFPALDKPQVFFHMKDMTSERSAGVVFGTLKKLDAGATVRVDLPKRRMEIDPKTAEQAAFRDAISVLGTAQCGNGRRISLTSGRDPTSPGRTETTSLEGTVMHIKSTAPAAPASIPDTKATGQNRSLERGKATRKKNPGKRAKSGG